MRDDQALRRIRELIERADEELERWHRANRQLDLTETRTALEVASSALMDRIRSKVSERVSPSSR